MVTHALRIRHLMVNALNKLHAHVKRTNVPFFYPSPKFVTRSKAVHSWAYITIKSVAT